MIYQRVHSATMAIAQQHERMMEEMEKSSQVRPVHRCHAHSAWEGSEEGRKQRGKEAKSVRESHTCRQRKKQNSVSEETFAEKLIKTQKLFHCFCLVTPR